jgi:hypothetical protein
MFFSGEDKKVIPLLQMLRLGSESASKK